MDRYSKAAADRAALIRKINQQKARRKILRDRADDPLLGDILGALGLGEPEPDARRCPHCGVVLAEASSRCVRTSCRMKIAALNEVGRTAEAEIDHLTTIGTDRTEEIDD